MTFLSPLKTWPYMHIHTTAHCRLYPLNFHSLERRLYWSLLDTRLSCQILHHTIRKLLLFFMKRIKLRNTLPYKRLMVWSVAQLRINRALRKGKDFSSKALSRKHFHTKRHAYQLRWHFSWSCFD